MTRISNILCFSHLRWGFVYQRPNHLMARFAKNQKVYFIEEPFESQGQARLDIREREPGLNIVVPLIPHGLTDAERVSVQRELLDGLIADNRIRRFAAWYYTPMALTFSRHLSPDVTVYDCMDELTGFLGCPPELKELETELLSRADVVFTGGQSLYESKRKQHGNAHPFPSSVDRDHFARARGDVPIPADLERIPHPRLGYIGVLDERINFEIVDQMAAARPDWQIVLVGPVVKIDPERMPRRANIHYLGQKMYKELPNYLAGFDVALMPFALNDATRFISPTKTLEYLAAGKRIVSTPIHDVVRPYGESGIVEIVENGEDAVAAVERMLSATQEDEWLARVDETLRRTSWDRTWSGMSALMQGAADAKVESLFPATTTVRAAVRRAPAAEEAVQ